MNAVMRKRLGCLAVLAGGLLLSSSGWAGEKGPVIGDTNLLDTVHQTGFVIPLAEWYAAHPILSNAPTRGDKVFASPRALVTLVSNKGKNLIGPHYHTSADEIAFVYKGQGEMYIDGKWVPVKAGDLHVNPRGVIHTTRVTGDEPMLMLSIFTPPQANGNDKILVDVDAQVVPAVKN